MSNETKSSINSYKSLIWVVVILVFIVGVQMYFTLQFEKKIREQVVIIKKLELTQRNGAEIDSLKSVIKDLEEFAADSDERCAIQMDQIYSKLVECQINNPNIK